MAVNIRDTPQFQQGRNGEQVVARWLQRHGFYVIPSYDYSGEEDKPPKMQGQKVAYVLPDLDVCRAGERKWIEVKTKTEAPEYRVTGQRRHGINERHLESYMAIQRETGSQVWLAIYELNPKPVLLMAPIDLLAKSIAQPGGRSWGMLFWDRAVFTEHDINELTP